MRLDLLLHTGRAAAVGGLLAGGALLCGCPAEQLGVELPRGGALAISQEDLRRDAWLVQQVADPAAAAGEVGKRLSQMRLLPAFGDAWIRAGGQGPVACGRKDGAGQGSLLVIAVGDPGTTSGAVAWAGLVSLAKGWDLPGVPARSRILCVAAGPEAAQALLATPPVPVQQVVAAVSLGPLHGAAPALTGPLDPGPGGTPPTWRLEVPGPMPDGLGEVDYRLVEAGTRQALEQLDNLPL